MAEEVSAFDRTELRQVYKAFSLLGDEAKAEARQTSNNLATYLQQQIAAKASTRVKGQQAINRIVNTQMLWAGFEFGSNRFKQFPAYSGRQGRGSRGWFIYPTLRQEQKNIVAQWTRAFNKILDKWGISGI